MYRKVVKIAMESSYTPHSDYTLGWYICYNLWTSIDLLLLTKVHTLFRSPQPTPQFFPRHRVPGGHGITPPRHLKPHLPGAVPQALLVFDDHEFWGSQVKYPLEYPSVSMQPMFFSWLDWGGFLGESSPEIKCHFHDRVLRIHASDTAHHHRSQPWSLS